MATERVNFRLDKKVKKELQKIVDTNPQYSSLSHLLSVAAIEFRDKYKKEHKKL